MVTKGAFLQIENDDSDGEKSCCLEPKDQSSND